MPEIQVYTNGMHASIDQLSLQRDWMDITFDRHAYQCFPISLSNRIGWGISYPEDITFIWDGVNDADPSADHVKVISGNKHVHTGRANRTISFNTDLTFVCDEEDDLSLLTMPVPNQFIRGTQCITTVISPSALQGQLPIAWIITEPDLEITIPAGTPVASVIPIELSKLGDYPVQVKTGNAPFQDEAWSEMMRDRGIASQKLNQAGKWTNFYRNAVNHLGQPMGKHEVKKIIMEVSHD